MMSDDTLESPAVRRALARWMVFNLFLAALFALAWHKAGFWHYVPNALLVPVRIYGGVTGATGSYGFFSPDVTPELRARFLLHTAQGDVPRNLFDDLNRESHLRVGNLVDAQWEYGAEQKALDKNRALAASYAGKLLDRHPEAHAVTVIVEYYQIRPLADGVVPLPSWELHYRARYERTRGAKGVAAIAPVVTPRASAAPGSTPGAAP